MHPVEQYVDDVLEGRVTIGTLARLSVERHARDLETGAERGLYFDPEAAQHRLDFCELCKHFEGRWAGQIFEPEPWQQFVMWCVYGWMRENGTRRFRESYLSVGRKNGKTFHLAGDGLYLTGCDGEAGAQVFSAATKRDQAKIVWLAAKAMIAKSPELKALFQMAQGSIYVPESFSKFIPLGRESKTEDGLNPHGALIDEYHAHPDAGLYEILESGMGAREQPLILTITTRGFNIDCACRELEELVVEILNGRVQNDSIFGVIHTIDAGDDWHDEECWIKANPNLGVSIDIDELRRHHAKALHISTEENSFRTRRVNQWTEAKTIWFTSEAWNACAGDGPIDERSLWGCPSWGSLDLSTTTDFSAWLLAVKGNGKINLVPRFFVPDDNVAALEDKCKIPLRQWIRDGHVIATPGNVVDYDFVETQMDVDHEHFPYDEFAFDPWNATGIVTSQEQKGRTPVELRQGYATMNPICKSFEKHVLAHEINHGGNPVLAWMCRCCEIAEDPAGNIKPVKPKRSSSGKRIDGMVAAVMATARADVGNGPKRSVYESRGVRVVG